MTLRSTVHRALSILSSLSPQTNSRRIAGAATLLVLNALTLGKVEASRLHHFAPHRHLSVRHSLRLHNLRRGGMSAASLRSASAGVAAPESAGKTSGSLLQPASNLQAVLTPSTTLATAAVSATEAASAPRYELRLHHTHTDENIDIVYRIGNTYIPSAIARLNYFLRDHRTQSVSHYDPREFDLLHSVLMALGKDNDVIDIVCGYRTPWSNNYLRTRAPETGVARNSQHTQAKAIDIRVPGVSIPKLRNAALSLHGGGVGYYPVSAFVHVDVGPVRQWTYAGPGE